MRGGDGGPSGPSDQSGEALRRGGEQPVTGLAPLSQIRRLAAFRQRTTNSLAPGVVRLALDIAEVLSEGTVRSSDGQDTFYGTTMLTIDLQRLSSRLRFDPSGDSAALLACMARSAELRLRALRAARLEAERRIEGRLPGPMRADLSARIEGSRLLIDVEVELPVDEDLPERLEELAP